MSAHGFFTPPAHENEPVKSYAPGTPERAELQARLQAMQGERVSTIATESTLESPP